MLTTKLDVLMRLLETSNPTMYNLYMLAKAQDRCSRAVDLTIAATVADGATTTIHSSAAYDENTFYTIQK
ncbi:MAG: hypothetical protein H7199_07170 [Burkholderiales bacterium]|nr:hypothetical protein [Flavobacterium sp.]